MSLFSGGKEGYFFALDARTGELLWKASVGGQVNAGPMSYSVNGKQYVTIAAGNALFAFALPGGPMTRTQTTKSRLPFVSFVIFVIFVCVVGAQSPAYKVPRTPDGQPDLQGFWTNATYTPLERPDNVTKEFYTPAEAVAAKKLRLQRESAADGARHRRGRALRLHSVRTRSQSVNACANSADLADRGSAERQAAADD